MTLFVPSHRTQNGTTKPHHIRQLSKAVLDRFQRKINDIKFKL